MDVTATAVKTAIQKVRNDRAKFEAELTKQQAAAKKSPPKTIHTACGLAQDRRQGVDNVEARSGLRSHEGCLADALPAKSQSTYWPQLTVGCARTRPRADANGNVKRSASR